MAWLLALLFITVGAALQRVTGLGFALVSGPLLVLVLDPFNGIVLANALSAVIAALVLSRTFRQTDWRSAGKLLLGIGLGLPIGAVLVHSLSPNVLLIVVGALTSVAVLPALLQRSMRIFTGRGGALLAGTISGFSNITAGVGGPALALYGTAAAMPMLAFVPTMQAVGLVTNVLSVLSKPQLQIPLPLAGASLACVAVGLALGTLLHRRISPKHAQILALALALVGSVAATARGVLSLVA